MGEEIQLLEQNETWLIEDLLPSKKPINCKWVYKLKYKVDGNIKRSKARLVVRGDLQLEGFDFNEIFAPKMTTVCTFLSFAVTKG